MRRKEAYRGACPYCTSIRDRVLTVVPDDKEPKDWDNEVWPSKNNIGRSASPRKRVGTTLVLREPDELWSIPAGTVHPHCRGGWAIESGGATGVSPEMAAYVRSLLNKTA